MQVVITGGAGFIGSNLCRRLANLPEVRSVIALDDLSTGFAGNLIGVDKTTLVEGTILDSGTLDRVLEGADAVVHLGARPSVPRSIQDPLASHHANVTGTLQVLEAARRHGAPHVLLASSSSVYGGNPSLPKHEGLVPAPLSPYAASKLAAEAYAMAYGASFGLDVLSFRFFNVFGPMQAAGHAYAAVIPAFLSAALDGRPLTVHGDGRQTRDFTYVGSVTSVLADAVIRRVSSPGPVNLAFGSRTSLLDVIALVEQILGRSLTIEHAPSRPGDVKDSQADDTLLRTLFPALEPVSLEHGLRATIEWFEAARD